MGSCVDGYGEVGSLFVDGDESLSGAERSEMRGCFLGACHRDEGRDIVVFWRFGWFGILVLLGFCSFYMVRLLKISSAELLLCC